MANSRPFGNIRKLPSGRYQARYWHLGKQVPADTTFGTKADARAWLATMETDLLSGRHVDPSSGRERFGSFAERWLEARDLRPRTRDTYSSQLAHILDEFETIELRKITPSSVLAWHGRLSKSGLKRRRHETEISNARSKIERLPDRIDQLDKSIHDETGRLDGLRHELADARRLNTRRPELETRLHDVDSQLADDRRIRTRQLRRNPPERVTDAIGQRPVKGDRIRAWDNAVGYRSAPGRSRSHRRPRTDSRPGRHKSIRAQPSTRRVDSEQAHQRQRHSQRQRLAHRTVSRR